ncbi:MAG: ferritin-like domain-containing protein [Alphaproteobacteria bacterium]|nr:ferritin-like domain-containing protein [Alphaproteobacteria bacterium]
MSDGRDRVVQWLRDAHAMEQQAETMLNAQASRLEHYPKLRQRIQRHIEETKTQAARLQTCLGQLASDTSGVKDLAGRLAAMAQGLGGMFAGDEVVKGAMAGYVFEHVEIASYVSLISAAEHEGLPEAARVCRENLEEERAMADWLQNHLPDVTRAFLAREQAGGPAKR